MATRMDERIEGLRRFRRLRTSLAAAQICPRVNGLLLLHLLAALDSPDS